MITLYTGVPGAGKTYKMVADLDAFIADYESKATDANGPPLTVITNIRELKLPHVDFDELIMERFPDKSLKVTERIERFFDYDYQKGLNDHFGGPLMYLIDECQTFFPKRTSLPNTEAYLQRHRHLGHNIYLATQAIRQVNGNVICLVELEYFAAPRTKSLFGEFRYHVKTPQSRDVITVKNIRPQKRVFELYKSFDAKEIQKPKKLLLRKLWPVLLVPVAMFLFYRGFHRIGGRPSPEPVRSAVTAQTSAPTASTPALTGSSEETRAKMIALQQQVNDLQKRLYEVERVFLMVVKQGDRKITIDPDTQAVVEITKVKHKVTCVNDGLTCYFDRPVNSAVKVAGTAINNAMSHYSAPGGNSVMPWPVPPSTEPEGRAGPGSFIDPSMFEGLK